MPASTRGCSVSIIGISHSTLYSTPESKDGGNLYQFPRSPVQPTPAQPKGKDSRPAPTEAHVSFHCTCGNALRTQFKNGGKKVKCPKCGAFVFVPRFDQDANTSAK